MNTGKFSVFGRLENQLKLENKLSLQQVIFVELLPLNRYDIRAKINRMINENPLVEVDEPMNYKDENVDESIFEEIKTENDIEKQQISSDVENLTLGELSKKTDISMEEFFNQENFQSKILENQINYNTQYNPSKDHDFQFKIAKENVSLKDIILFQLNTLTSDKEILIAGELLVDCFDHNGLITSNLADLSTVLQKDLELLEKTLQFIKTFDPPGIGATSIEECFIIQLKRKGYSEDSLPIKLIKNNGLTVIKNRDLNKLKKLLNIEDIQVIKNTIEIIKSLNARPSNGSWEDKKIITIKPDFRLQVNNGIMELTSLWGNFEYPEVKIILNKDDYKKTLENLKERLKNNKINKDEIIKFNKNYEEAIFLNDLKKHLKDRDYSLKKVVKKLIEIQRDFLMKKGPLKPLIYKTIADDLKLSASTVGRVIQNKYIDTPIGLLCLKKLFSSSVSTDSNINVSSRSIRSEIKKIIENEDINAPFTDDQLSGILKKKGYNIARRTIAKYRKLENILPSKQRKSL